MKRIVLAGFGNVGKSFFKLIQNCPEFELSAIVRRSGGWINGQWEQGLTVPDALDRILPDIFVELTPTDKQTGQPALSYLRHALQLGCSVVTANKGPILFAYDELTQLASQNNVTLQYGSTVGGALPTLIVAQEGLAGSQITAIEGVLNGTSNYLLTRMEESVLQEVPLRYDELLCEAINAGIAETDPSFDVEGYDTAIKLLIIAHTLWEDSRPLTLRDVRRTGMTGITPQEMQAAIHRGERIKLVASAYRNWHGELQLIVRPEFITPGSYLAR